MKIEFQDTEKINQDLKDINTYCKDCKRSIYGEYANCDINIENDGKYVRGQYPCYCKIGLDGKRAEKYPWEEGDEL